MRTRWGVLVLALGAAVTTATLAGCSGADPAPDPTSSARASATATRADPADLTDRFAILGRTFAATDALPDDIGTVAPDTMVPNSQRFAVEHAGTRYWVAAERNGGVCLIAWNPDPDSVDSYSVCGATPTAKASVVTSMLDEAGHQTVLVSDGFEDHGSDALRELAPNVWVH